MSSSTKPGVASVEELTAFVDDAGDRLVVVDVRNPDAQVEPGDQKSLAVAPLPSTEYRPQAIHAVWDRTTNTLQMDELKDLSKDTPIITHCGGGGRGQLAKEYLQQQHGFTNVLNGAGPKETELWAVYGNK
ncbi:rhodanese-like domain containing protein [Nitzschia inconspicua]|uniref:Rhodanese-like domain containing protein n=1 Tax=Nitzschia inconspicua TaxID=303405 RepID=A0A9K3KA81_9STRA|nr:rhodanese-like domain containing protein [Nitzschia inconspicua]KAG7362471.1 rhodanese-like domain containing protein [Nitzschia inconspicua]